MYGVGEVLEKGEGAGESVFCGVLVGEIVVEGLGVLVGLFVGVVDGDVLAEKPFPS